MGNGQEKTEGGQKMGSESNCCFTWDFSDLVQPLVDLTKKDKPFQ